MIKRLTIFRLLLIIRNDNYAVVYKKWTGRHWVWLGDCKHKEAIRINYNRIYKLSQEERRDLFVHEFLHAYFGHKDLDTILCVKDEEAITEALAKDICKRASKKQLDVLDNLISKSLRKADRQFKKSKK